MSQIPISREFLSHLAMDRVKSYYNEKVPNSYMMILIQRECFIALLAFGFPEDVFLCLVFFLHFDHVGMPFDSSFFCIILTLIGCRSCLSGFPHTPNPPKWGLISPTSGHKSPHGVF